MCARALHRTQREASFQAICGRQKEVPRSKNEKLVTTLLAASERPVNPLVDLKHREDIHADKPCPVQYARAAREHAFTAVHYLLV